MHIVFHVKHNLRHKARLILAGGHMTEVPKDSTYSLVASLRRFAPIATFIAELKQLDLCAEMSETLTWKHTQKRKCVVLLD